MAESIIGITASIMTLLAFTNSVISVCHDYTAAARGAPWQLTQTRAELEGLRNVLQALEPLVKQAEVAPSTSVIKLPALALLVRQDGLLRKCETEIKRLETKLKTPSWAERRGKKWTALAEALKWPFQESETSKILSNIRNFRDNLASAIDGDTAQLALATQKLSLSTNHTVKATHGDVNWLKDAASKVQKDITSTTDATLEVQQYARSEQSDNQRQKIQSWLSAPDPSTNYSRALDTRSSNTGGWFLESEAFELWCQRQSLIWLRGACGRGKTILSSTIIHEVIERYALQRSTAIAYYFFDFSEIKKQNLENMLRSLASQLLKQFHGNLSPLKTIHDGMSRLSNSESVLQILKFLLEGFDKTYIILDALDECSDRHELEKIIQAIQAWKCPQPNVLITSRKFSDIERMFESVTWPQQRVDIQATEVDADILTYVDDRFKSDQRLKRWQKNVDVQEEIKRTLLEKANGMFRWVACQLDSLQGCLTRQALRRALASLPKTLDETYARILRNIPKEHGQDAVTILQWLAFSERRLRVEELAEVIAINIAGKPWLDVDARLEDPREILELCPGLIDIEFLAEMISGDVVQGVSEEVFEEVSEEEPNGFHFRATSNEFVRLAHFSVKEYLISERIHSENVRQYAVQEISAHENMASACLAYLLQFDEPGKLTGDFLKDFPLAEYAATYWTQHTHALGKKLDSVRPLCLEFLLGRQKAFLNWIRLRYWNPHDDRVLDTHPQTKDAAPPLCYMSERGVTEVVSLLLEGGADVDAADKYGVTALAAASWHGHQTVMRLLLNRGANVNFHGRGVTALQAAAMYGHDSMVQLLLDHGADVNLQGGEYGTALQAAAWRGSNSIVQLLLDYGADVNLQGGRYGTALQAAAAVGDDLIVQLLLDYGADVNLQGGKYGTAFAGG